MQLDQPYAKTVVVSSSTLSTQIKTLQDKTHTEAEAIKTYVGAVNDRLAKTESDGRAVISKIMAMETDMGDIKAKMQHMGNVTTEA